MRIILLLMGLVLISSSCKNEEIVKKEEMSIEGKFLKIEKINDRLYTLYLKTDSDSILVFKTVPFFTDIEISYLKKEGNNVKLTYKELLNPVTKKIEYYATIIHPIYEFSKK